MKKPSKTVSVQLPKEDIAALESLIGQTRTACQKEFVVKRLSDAIRFAMAYEIEIAKGIMEDEIKKAQRAAAAKAKRQAKKEAASGL
jgi:hypothetical protein